MERLGKKLCLPYLMLKRPDWDKFPGAFYSLAADALMPDGRTLQIGTIHQYKENFSKPYEIKYEAPDGQHKYVHQTTYGMSERLIGAIIGVHGDNKGVILPPAVAPYQVVLVPIFAKKSKAKILNECNKLKEELINAGFRVHFDARDIRPGSKYYDWELRGVPLRLELGPRDLDGSEVTVVRRDSGKREVISRKKVIKSVKDILTKIEESLFTNAEAKMKKAIITVDALEEAKDKSGIIRMGWCGEPECDDQIVKFLDINMLGTPIHDEGYKGNCAQCGKPTTTVAYYARTY
jgi:prolyl-tRNA synthetase